MFIIFTIQSCCCFHSYIIYDISGNIVKQKRAVQISFLPSEFAELPVEVRVFGYTKIIGEMNSEDMKS